MFRVFFYPPPIYIYPWSCPCQWITIYNRQWWQLRGWKYILPIASTSCQLWHSLLVRQMGLVYTRVRRKKASTVPTVWDRDAPLRPRARCYLERVRSYPSSQLPVSPDSTLPRWMLSWHCPTMFSVHLCVHGQRFLAICIVVWLCCKG